MGMIVGATANPRGETTELRQTSVTPAAAASLHGQKLTRGADFARK
jgi:hypothetical protein